MVWHSLPQVSKTTHVECTLYLQLADLPDADVEFWTCEVFGVDSESGMYTDVEIEGMEHVLAQNPNIESGRTTLLAQGASLSNGKLAITAGNSLSFGDNTNWNVARRRRRLSASSGNLDVLVVRVTTADAALTKLAPELSGDIFGTADSGDTINFKSVVEDCSNDVTTINPAIGTGTGCADDSTFVVDLPITYNGNSNCDAFNNLVLTSNPVPGSLCSTYGKAPYTDIGSKTHRVSLLVLE